MLRASHVSALAPVCDVLVEEGILSLELTLTTPGLLDALPELVDRYADTADVGVGTILTESDARTGHRMRRAVPGHPDHEPAGGQTSPSSARLRSFPAA